MAERDETAPAPAPETGPPPGPEEASQQEPRPAMEPANEPAPSAEPVPRLEAAAQAEAGEPSAGAAGEEPAHEPSAEPAPARAAESPPPRLGWLAEHPEREIEVARRALRAQSRRDFLLFAAGTAAAATAAWWLLPDRTRGRLLPQAHDRLDTLVARVGLSRDHRERALNRALTFDDDVAEALYSRDRSVRTYAMSDVTSLRNNYHGATPGPEMLQGWSLALSGLASGASERLTLEQLLARFPLSGQVTRLVCVEGWSAIAWWGGIRFADLLGAYPPAPGSRWAAMRSTVSLDERGRPEPYYVSIDLETARHPQTLLATHYRGQPLTPAHGAPLRLVAPMKLGLKNIKAVTDIIYMPVEPPDYWNERGYSRYDGL